MVAMAGGTRRWTSVVKLAATFFALGRMATNNEGASAQEMISAASTSAERLPAPRGQASGALDQPGGEFPAQNQASERGRALDAPAEAQAGDGDAYAGRVQGPTPPEDTCWVYTHMNKSGGTTVKRLLRPVLDGNKITYGLFDNPQWKRGLSFLRDDILQRDLKMIWGGYTEGIRRFGMRKCKWFTVFRHPVNRLVSAFFYCKTNGHDALCGTSALPANSTDIVSFAQHWSNFGLRQYALAYVSPEAVLTSPLAKKEPDHPAWYLLKRFFDGPKHPEGTRIPDLAMRDLLEPAQKLLGSQYAAVGILEEWENSLELFNVALEFPNFNWTTAFLSLGEQNKVDDEAHRLEYEALEKAQTDVNIKRFLRLDILLYEQAIAVHRRQVKEYRIGE